MNQFGYIYRVTNLVNGTVYVGQRRGEFQGWYYGSGKLIKRAIEKYGAKNFALEFVQSALNQRDLDVLEAHFIAEARAAGRTYNIRDGGLGSLWNGKGTMHGKKHTEETKKKMSQSHSGLNSPWFGKGHLLSGDKNPRFGAKLTEETKRKIGAANRLIRGADHGNFGKVRSVESRAKISASKKGKATRVGWKMTDQQKAKISASRKAMFAAGYEMTYSEETRRKISEGRKRYWARVKEGIL